MHTKRSVLSTLVLTVLLLTACSSLAAPTSETSVPVPVPTTTPEWFDMKLVDAQTGETFTMNDFKGKVVLVETMAMWCPNCLFQAGYVRKFHNQLKNPDDLISVSLDVDVNEDQASLKDYVAEYGFEWRFAVAPLLVARALGNLYSAEYLNPPLSPMLIIDRDGNVHQLEYGTKNDEKLQELVGPYLQQ